MINQGTFPWGCPHFWGDLSARSARSRPRIKNNAPCEGRKISTSPLVTMILPKFGTRSNIMGYNIYFVPLRVLSKWIKTKKPLILRGFLRKKLIRLTYEIFYQNSHTGAAIICYNLKRKYIRTNEKRLIGAGNADKPSRNRTPCERYSCCCLLHYNTKNAQMVQDKEKIS